MEKRVKKNMTSSNSTVLFNKYQYAFETFRFKDINLHAQCTLNVHCACKFMSLNLKVSKAYRYLLNKTVEFVEVMLYHHDNLSFNRYRIDYGKSFLYFALIESS